MSTRGSIYYSHDQETAVTVPIYDELAGIDTQRGLRLEVEHPFGVVNVACPIDMARAVTRHDTSSLEPTE